MTKDVPDYAIVAGNPAKILKYRFDEATIARLKEIRWWDWDLDYIRAHMDSFKDVNAIINLAEKDDRCDGQPE